MNILSLFDYTGNMVNPWLAAGHDCWIVDIQHDGPSAGSVERHASGARLTKLNHNINALVDANGRSLCNWIPWDMVFAFPPCDDLAVSGARWFKEKGMGRLVAALQNVESARSICEQAGCPYLIENPVSTLSTYWREPDARIEPWHFNDGRECDTYWKHTCLWTGGGFVTPEKSVDPRTTNVMRLADVFYSGITNRAKLITAVRNDYELCDNWFPDDRIHKASPGPDRKNTRSKTPIGFAHAVYSANCRTLDRTLVGVAQ